MEATSKICQNCKSSFTIESEDFDFYKKLVVPPPTFCPDCRFQRRMAFFNERNLYKRNCDLCKKSMVSMYRPDSGLIVYCNECWWSDKWDPAEYWADYDPSRPFIKQVDELIRKTPQVTLSLNYPTLVNSDYINHAATSKNCYLIFTADWCENVLYSTILENAKDSMDCLGLGKSELCYESTMIENSSRVFFSDYCIACHNVYFSKNCSGCTDCFGCMNLRNKRYHIFNEPYTKEEYEKKLKEFGIDSNKNLQELKKKAKAFWLSKPQRFANAVHSVNVTGNYIYNSKNSKNMYQVGGAEDCRYCQFLTVETTKDSYDYSIWGNNAQRIYECFIVGEGADTIKFSNQSWNQVLDVEYSFWTTSSSHMFGCANIRKKQYCILNKQYSKEEFEALKAKIIDDMNRNPYVDAVGREYRYGEFFPAELSLHTYNETQANDFFPLTEEEAKKEGFRWGPLPIPPQSPTLTADQIPDRIQDTTDTILKEILECELCKRPFIVIPAELALLRNFNMPVPRRCFYCRHTDRLLHRINQPHLYPRTCAKCGKGIETSFAPGSPEIVYCEQCYQAEVS